MYFTSEIPESQELLLENRRNFVVSVAVIITWERGQTTKKPFFWKELRQNYDYLTISELFHDYSQDVFSLLNFS